ncbi:FbpB family small basic protein [Sutcliffiella horikoshii]|uniref:FbpB family small basic protein n=1 Tax=Sutcliffiella horikoshii TaxID=79883 RepID=A0A5D4SYX4_9BACI|nr:FbpB family small basic protein [Sutcliffiella horikoshii]TYS67422.1 FbpB family small basic protein [Sutcliffiella horikoshii]
MRKKLMQQLIEQNKQDILKDKVKMEKILDKIDQARMIKASDK